MLNDLFSIPSFEYVSGMIIFKDSAIGPGSKGHAPNKSTLRAYGLGATTDALTLKWVSWHALWATGFGVSCLHQRISNYTLRCRLPVFETLVWATWQGMILGKQAGRWASKRGRYCSIFGNLVSLGSWNSYCLWKPAPVWIQNISQHVPI